MNWRDGLAIQQPAAIIGWAIAVAALVVGAGGAVSAEIDQFASCQPALLAANSIALACGLSFMRMKRGRAPMFIAMMLAEALLAFNVAPEFAHRFNSAGDMRAPGAQVRVVSLNMWNANPDAGRAIRWIAEMKPDVVVLAEANSHIAEIDAALADYPTRVTCEEAPYCGVAIYSRLPGRALPGGWDMARGLVGRTTAPGGLRFAAVELAGPDGRAFTVAAAHLRREGGTGPRQQETRLLAERIAALPHREAIILAGDFNASAWSHAMRRIEQGLPLRRATRALDTWPSPAIRFAGLPAPAFLPLDHVFLGPDWTADISRGPDVGSDHYPVLAALERVSRTGSNSPAAAASLAPAVE
jgi:endonuclease/exonuclease/phosphatase (EEP) superfamily protein YafD